MFNVSHLTVKQGQRTLWQDFSLCLATGERIGISAPSGYGKTTLGRVLAGWQSCQQGEICLNNIPLKAYQKSYCPIQLVPQHPELTFNPHRTTGQALYDAWQPEEAQLYQYHVLPEWLQRKPHQLSGGELARIALLRALDPRTQVLIADEITAQLDPHIQRDIWQQLIKASEERSLGMIVFSHQQALLRQICTRVVYAE